MANFGAKEILGAGFWIALGQDSREKGFSGVEFARFYMRGVQIVRGLGGALC